MCKQLAEAAEFPDNSRPYTMQYNFLQFKEHGIHALRTWIRLIIPPVFEQRENGIKWPGYAFVENYTVSMGTDKTVCWFADGKVM